MTRKDGATIRLPYPDRCYDIICIYSAQREKKARREFETQLARAKELIARKESGKRAKFIKKSPNSEPPFVLDEELKGKTKQLLGIKGYCTNIPKDTLSDDQAVLYYHNLWRIEQAFRMSKTDFETWPIFHWTRNAIKAHVLLCFIALMTGKFLEIKTGLSLHRIRDIVWNVHEVHIEDALTGERITLQTNSADYQKIGLSDVLKPH